MSFRKSVREHVLQTEPSPLRLNPVPIQGPSGEAGGVARELTTVTGPGEGNFLTTF